MHPTGVAGMTVQAGLLLRKLPELLALADIQGPAIAARVQVQDFWLESKLQDQENQPVLPTAQAQVPASLRQHWGAETMGHLSISLHICYCRQPSHPLQKARAGQEAGRERQLCRWYRKPQMMRTPSLLRLHLPQELKVCTVPVPRQATSQGPCACICYQPVHRDCLYQGQAIRWCRSD